MQVDYRYRGESTVASGVGATRMSFAPDTLRPPTFFNGRLAAGVPFREAISALHAVVTSDLRYRPKDREAYLQWAAEQEQRLLEEMLAHRGEVEARIVEKQAELDAVRLEKGHLMRPFLEARRRYFQYIYKRDYNAWLVLDPVITVHPDEIFFECFSRDESSYGRLACGYEVFHELGERACGTTNVDYSSDLYDAFQKIRDYKRTDLVVDPSGFEVQTTGEASYREVKIDLPDSWVRGFLQVSSAMTAPAQRVDLHPMDVHNICFLLRRRKERHGPRSLRFHLVPGEPLKITFEPWNLELRCPRSLYGGDEAGEIRVWGRRRLLILERLIPIARRFTVHLLGTGLPTFWLADLGSMSFTLGLSGWTANDWSRLGNFDLMAPRAEVDDLTQGRVIEALREDWLATPDALAERLDLDRRLVLGALSAYTQAGRAMYDLGKGVYRARELSREPLPMKALRFANEREAAAEDLLAELGDLLTRADDLGEGRTRVRAEVEARKKAREVELVLDADERLVRATCTCDFFYRNKLYQGPCEHMLAARKAHQRRRQPRFARWLLQ